MAVKDGLLALLVAGPQHGYQLKLDFERVTGHRWRLNIGQVYTTLQRLERDGMVVIDGIDDEGRIGHRLTDAGAAAVDEWFASAVAHREAERDEVVMKVLMAGDAGPAAASSVIASQRAATEAALRSCVEAAGRAPDVAESLNLERHRLRCEAELTWLDRAEEAIGLRALSLHDAGGAR